jgi:hypothetical protein
MGDFDEADGATGAGNANREINAFLIADRFHDVWSAAPGKFRYLRLRIGVVRIENVGGAEALRQVEPCGVMAYRNNAVR